MSAIDFDLTRIRGVAFDLDGVLSPATVPTAADGMPVRMVNIKDGYALQLAVKCGLRIAVITGATAPGIAERYNSLGVTDVFMGAAWKTQVLDSWLAANGMTAGEVAYAGDDVPDYEVMKRVGLAVAPADACPDVKEIARYISPFPGGYGVARDLLEQILRAQGHWMSHARAFRW